MWECPECSVDNDLDPEAEEGQILICLECDAEFEITSMDPLELEALEVVEDDDDDGDSTDDDEQDWSEE